MTGSRGRLGNPVECACATILVGLLNRRRQYSHPPPNPVELLARRVGAVALEGRAWITRAQCPVSLSWCVCLFIVAFWEIPDASNGLLCARRLALPFWRCIRSVLREYPDECFPQFLVFFFALPLSIPSSIAA